MKKLMFVFCIICLSCTDKRMKVIPQEFLVVTDPKVGLGIFRALDLEGKELHYEDTICIYGMGDTIEINSSQIRSF